MCRGRVVREVTMSSTRNWAGTPSEIQRSERTYNCSRKLESDKILYEICLLRRRREEGLGAD